MDESKNETTNDDKLLAKIPIKTEAIDDDLEFTPQSTYTNEFILCPLNYRGQACDPGLDNVTINSDSLEEFLEKLFQTIQPMIKRAVEFTNPNHPSWSKKENPTKEDLQMYVSFKDRVQKRTWRIDNLDGHILMRWANRVLLMQVYVHSMNIRSLPMWKQVQQELLADPGCTPSYKIPQDEDESRKLQTIVKRLKKIHQSYLMPKVDDAYKQWAALIWKEPVRKHRKLCFNKPPPSLQDSFKLIEEETPSKPIPEPIQRDDPTDGFGFEDEVHALRQTVTQIKDLVEMLDKRVELLEEKCQKTQQEIPLKKRKFNHNTDEPNNEHLEEGTIDGLFNEDSTFVSETSSGIPDTVDFVKEEYEIIEPKY